jgi:hypothetical protein
MPAQEAQGLRSYPFLPPILPRSFRSSPLFSTLLHSSSPAHPHFCPSLLILPYIQGRHQRNKTLHGAKNTPAIFLAFFSDNLPACSLCFSTTVANGAREPQPNRFDVFLVKYWIGGFGHMPCISRRNKNMRKYQHAKKTSRHAVSGFLSCFCVPV